MGNRKSPQGPDPKAKVAKARMERRPLTSGQEAPPSDEKTTEEVAGLFEKQA